MSLPLDLRVYLAAQAAIEAIVGRDPQGTVRVYAGSAPQSQPRPYVVVRQIGGGDQHNLDGAAAWRQPRLQVDCWANRYVQARELADAVRDAVLSYTGTWSGRRIAEVEIENDVDLPEANPISEGDFVHHVMLELRVLCARASG